MASRICCDAAVGTLKFKLTIAFDGTAYHGWQSQSSGRGVQDQVEAALKQLFGGDPSVQGSSRTDSGVHAMGMAAHFEVEKEDFKMPVKHLVLALNACLPDDIRVRSAVRVAPGFHARFDATGKQYRYHVWNHPAMNPLLRNHAWHVPTALDPAIMREAARCFIGRHDFRAFTSHRKGELGDPVREITRCEIRRSGENFTFIIEGGGFLYKMCRCMVGTLIQVGGGKFTVDDVKGLLDGSDRARSGINAPAHGLVLWKVFYPGRASR